MKAHQLIIGLLGLLTAFAAAWSKEDREIFRIRAEIQAHEANPETTFYELLGVKPGASIDEITKAYRKITRALHPDKVAQLLKAERAQARKDGKQMASGVNVDKPPTQREINAAIKVASERQARLGLVRNILSGPERDRYDHFLKNGFPTWKGTNYYYQRYRPGLGTVLAGLFLTAGGAMHWIALWLGHRRQRDFVERYIKFARASAWGDNLSIPGIDYAQPPAPAAAPAAAPSPSQEEDAAPPAQAVNRRQRRFEERAARKEKSKPKGKSASGGGGGGGGGSASASGTATPRDVPQGAPTGARKRVIAENGKVLIVDSLGEVYLEEEDEDGNLQQFLLDPSELKPPTFSDTAVVRLPLWLMRSTIGRFLGTNNPTGEDHDQDQDQDQDDTAEVDSDNDQVQHTPSGSTGSTSDDFEVLDKSTDSLRKAKTSGAQTGGRANKRKGNKKR
ncbi:hypothetical protein SODALDRAFT_334281 [Sodiomyces alkalinus F11]|uniref:J domain-containing protein n=1 Tax=Sodiomyces alkalinus (strain CBS 110278 / VKM F-3762 / F11) TaxID=1314773 RepID=A0A3N2PRW5_SODAK|nr:hypothetical protein SODALDRAFT_334281 [Sodiomyces alkalinus F11]ROT37200.1 hypothetical protein SODALDRAFT_334281 [Sodiomyces alkalinus F11]